MTEIQDRAQAFMQSYKAKAITVAHVAPEPKYGPPSPDTEQPEGTGGGYLQDLVMALVEKVSALEIRVEQLEGKR